MIPVLLPSVCSWISSSFFSLDSFPIAFSTARKFVYNGNLKHILTYTVFNGTFGILKIRIWVRMITLGFLAGFSIYIYILLTRGPGICISVITMSGISSPDFFQQFLSITDYFLQRAVHFSPVYQLLQSSSLMYPSSSAAITFHIISTSFNLNCNFYFRSLFPVRSDLNLMIPIQDPEHFLCIFPSHMGMGRFSLFSSAFI